MIPALEQAAPYPAGSCSKVASVEQAHSIFYILQDYSSLTLIERRGGWVLEVIVVVREQETDDY